MSKRLFYVDLLRVLACIAVITIHVSASNQYSINVESAAWQAFNVYDSLGRFCVPIFVMISGMFLLNTDKPLTIHRIYTKYIPQIGIAWVFWEIFYAAVQFIKSGQSLGVNSVGSVLNTALSGHYHLWYLPMLIGLYLATPVLRTITEKKDKAVCRYFLFLFFAFSVVKPTLLLFPLPGWAYTALNKIPFTLTGGYVGYFMLGFYLAAYPLSKRWRNAFYILAVLGAAATVIVSEFHSYETGVTSGIAYDFFSIPVIFMSIGVFLFFKEQASKIHYSETFMKAVNCLSSCSFGIYLIHAFVIERIYETGLTTMSFDPALSVPVISILGLFLSWVLVYILKRIPFAKKYIV